MSERLPQELDVPKMDENLGVPKKSVMWPVHTLSRLMIHPRTFFEEGAADQLHEDRDEGNANLILMSHFRRIEPLVMAQIARAKEPLRHLQYNTGITTRRGLHELPSLLGYIVRNSGAVIVDRPTENKDETEDQKQARREKNQEAQAIGGKVLARGGNWLIFPEGLTRYTIVENGEEKKVPRKPGVMLPVQKGFVYTLNSMTPEQLQRVKLLGIAVHYGGRLASSLRPTVFVTKPEVPIQGTVEEKRQQGEDILRRAIQEAILIDSLRRF